MFWGCMQQSSEHVLLRLAFDPPQSSTAMEALKNTVAEMEFRLNIEFDKAES